MWCAPAPVRIGTVAHEGFGQLAAALTLGRRDEAAVVVVVVGARKHVVLAAVLVLDRGVHAGEHPLEGVGFLLAVRSAPVGVGGVADVVGRQIALRLPVFRFDQLRNARPIGARRATEDAERRFAQRLLVVHALLPVLLDVSKHVAAQEVAFERLVERGDHSDRIIDTLDQQRKSVTEKAGDAGRHIEPGLPSSFSGMISTPGHTRYPSSRPVVRP